MSVDEHAEHAESLVMLDKSHPAHVCSEIVNVANAAAHCPLRCRIFFQVKGKILHILGALVPFTDGLEITTANWADAAPPQVCHKPASDEPSCPAHQHPTPLHDFASAERDGARIGYVLLPVIAELGRIPSSSSQRCRSAAMWMLAEGRETTNKSDRSSCGLKADLRSERALGFRRHMLTLLCEAL